MATNKEKEKLIASAQKLVEKGSFDKAIKEYLKVVADDDKDVRIWLKIGDLYAKLNKKQEAAETYDRVANHYSEEGFHLKSVAVYKQILKIDPARIEINQKLADSYKHLRLLTDASQQYEIIAGHYYREGKTKEALGALKQIVELDPATVANRIKLAEMYSKENMVPEAVAEFTLAADQLRESGRMDEFARVAERLLFHSPDNAELNKELAGRYIEKGDPRRALPKLQVCFKANPRDPDVLALLATAFERLEQKSKAISVWKELAKIHHDTHASAARDEVYRHILELEPQDNDARKGLSQGKTNAAANPLLSEAARNADEEELDHIEEADDGGIEGGPTALAPVPRVAAPAAHEEEAAGSPITTEQDVRRVISETDMLLKYRLYDKAVTHLQKVFAHFPTHIETHEKLKVVQLQRGRKDEAIAELWILAEKANPAEARRYLSEIVELEPDNQRARGILGTRGVAERPPIAKAVPAAAQEFDRREYSVAEELDVGDFEVLEDSAVIVMPPRSSRSEMDFAESTSLNDVSDMLISEETLQPTFNSRAHAMDAVDQDEELIPLIVDSSLEDTTDAGKRRAALRRDVEETDPQRRKAADAATLEADLEEADFFMQQQLFAEARLILEGLSERNPKNRLVLSKLRELAALEDPENNIDAVGHLIDDTPAEGIDSGEQNMAEMPLISSSEVFLGELTGQSFRKGVVEKGVLEEDYDTHFDLGIAYREMGLIDEAMNEFRIVMRQRDREVLCLQMIGTCLMDKGQYTDAINEYKKGLYVEGITERETLSLYFELGVAYEQLGDRREALYYYEKVQKRDPQFREVDKRMRGLTGGNVQEDEAVAMSVDDLDAAFDNLVDKK